MAQYKDFITYNIASQNARRIGIYDVNGNRVGQIPLGSLTPPAYGKRLYSFGALSDIHIGERADAKADTDLDRALTYFNDTVDFVCISGDLAHTGTEAQRTTYKSIVDTYSNIPVYAISGNHDGDYVANLESVIPSYTGQPLYYSITKGNDVFIFVGNATGSGGQLFTKAELQWLYETLEENRNRRCFLFQPDDGCGNALGIYTYDIWGGTESTVFESFLRHYKNVVFFHGHSHLKFYLQKYSDIANIEKNFGCWSVHVPSLAVPRDTASVVNPSRVELYADSEGYVVDVYEDGIHLRGRNFEKGEFLPIASYWLDTTLQTVAAGGYSDPTGTITT